jgi:hypothetical protein
MWGGFHSVFIIQPSAFGFALSDGGNTPRQLVNAAGEVTLTSSYTPCPQKPRFWNLKQEK